MPVLWVKRGLNNKVKEVSGAVTTHWHVSALTFPFSSINLPFILFHHQLYDPEQTIDIFSSISNEKAQHDRHRH